MFLCYFKGTQDIKCGVDEESGDIYLSFESCQITEHSQFTWKKSYQEITDFSSGITVKTSGSQWAKLAFNACRVLTRPVAIHTSLKRIESSAPVCESLILFLFLLFPHWTDYNICIFASLAPICFLRTQPRKMWAHSPSRLQILMASLPATRSQQKVRPFNILWSASLLMFFLKVIQL